MVPSTVGFFWKDPHEAGLKNALPIFSFPWEDVELSPAEQAKPSIIALFPLDESVSLILLKVCQASMHL